MENHRRFDPFGMIRSFVGAITGALSSLPSNPFHPKPPPIPLLPYHPFNSPKNRLSSSSSSPPPPPTTNEHPENHPILPTPEAKVSPLQEGKEQEIEENHGSGSSSLSLCPDMEIEESRKRFRDVLQEEEEEADKAKEMVAEVDITSMKKQKLMDDLGLPELSHETTVNASREDFEMTSVEENPNTSSAIPNSSSASSYVKDYYDEALVGYAERNPAAKRKSEDKDEAATEEKEMKKRRISSFNHGSDDMFKWGAGVKRKKPEEDEVDLKYEKKLKALSIDEEIGEEKGAMEEKEVPIDSQPILEENSGDDEDDDHEEKLKRRTVLVHNLPLNTRRRDISNIFAKCGAIQSINIQSNPTTLDARKRLTVKDEIIGKTNPSQTATIVYKEESSAKAAFSHNVKEFNGIYIYVDAPWYSGLSEDFSSLSSYDRARTVLVNNLPYDVKGEEVLEILCATSARAHIEALRVLRNASPALGASAVALFKSEASVRAFLSVKQTLKSKGKVVSVTCIRKRQRDPGAEDGHLKKKQAVNEESRSTTSTKQSQPLSTRARGLVGKVETTSESAKITSLKTLSGVKQKREERQQRGISRSKKIRRS